MALEGRLALYCTAKASTTGYSIRYLKYANIVIQALLLHPGSKAQENAESGNKVCRILVAILVLVIPQHDIGKHI